MALAVEEAEIMEEEVEEDTLEEVEERPDGKEAVEVVPTTRGPTRSSRLESMKDPAWSSSPDRCDSKLNEAQSVYLLAIVIDTL